MDSQEHQKFKKYPLSSILQSIYYDPATFRLASIVSFPRKQNLQLLTLRVVNGTKFEVSRFPGLENLSLVPPSQDMTFCPKLWEFEGIKKAPGPSIQGPVSGRPSSRFPSFFWPHPNPRTCCPFVILS